MSLFVVFSPRKTNSNFTIDKPFAVGQFVVVHGALRFDCFAVFLKFYHSRAHKPRLIVTAWLVWFWWFRLLVFIFLWRCGLTLVARGSEGTTAIGFDLALDLSGFALKMNFSVCTIGQGETNKNPNHLSRIFELKNHTKSVSISCWLLMI